MRFPLRLSRHQSVSYIPLRVSLYYGSFQRTLSFSVGHGAPPTSSWSYQETRWSLLANSRTTLISEPWSVLKATWFMHQIASYVVRRLRLLHQHQQESNLLVCRIELRFTVTSTVHTDTAQFVLTWIFTTYEPFLTFSSF